MYKVFLPQISNQIEPYYGLAWANQPLSDIDLLKASWFYVWSCKIIKHPTAQSVPMCKKTLDTSLPKDYSGFMLVFNEPNVSVQDNLTVDQAVVEYDKIRNYYPNAKLVVGNVSIFATKWLKDFCARRQIERVGIHCYEEYYINSAYISDKLDDLYSTINLPMWVTEFNNIYPDTDKFGRLLDTITSKSYVERVAPFTNRQAGTEWWELPNCDLVDKTGTLTTKGQIYVSQRKKIGGNVENGKMVK